MRMAVTITLSIILAVLLRAVVAFLEQTYGLDIHWTAVYAICVTAAVLIAMSATHTRDDDHYE